HKYVLFLPTADSFWSTNNIPVLFSSAEDQELFYSPVAELMDYLRGALDGEGEEFRVVREGEREMKLTSQVMGLEIGEDNNHAQSYSIADFVRVYHACGVDGILVLDLSFGGDRFGVSWAKLVERIADTASGDGETEDVYEDAVDTQGGDVATSKGAAAHVSTAPDEVSKDPDLGYNEEENFVDHEGNAQGPPSAEVEGDVTKGEVAVEDHVEYAEEEEQEVEEGFNMTGEGYSEEPFATELVEGDEEELVPSTIDSATKEAEDDVVDYPDDEVLPSNAGAT
ncbi:hypothetical protein BT69DRAFT_74085, partial [Atractiella rhizophila]